MKKIAVLVGVVVGCVAGGYAQVAQRVYIDIPAASTSVWFGSGSVGAVKYSTAQLMAGPVVIDVANAAKTQFVNVSTYPRNVVFCQYDLATGTNTIGGTVDIIGIDQFGNRVTEMLTIAGPSPAKISTGSVAFAVVERVVIRANSLRGGDHLSGYVGFTLGTGNKIGLMTDVRSSNDVIVCIDAGGARRSGYTVDAIRDTITFPTNPNGSNDYQVLVVGR